jgi:hypothetical protein
MKYFLILLTVATFTSARSQITEDSVRIAVNKMFTGMKNADAALLKSCFADSAILQTITRDKEGNVIVKNESITEFIGFVSKQPSGAADERITFETIKIDGPLAIAWTPYNFYFNGQFSHCGVNSFQLVRLRGEWKIQYIIDTRRRKQP